MRHTIGIVWDELTSAVQCQITRDLMLLSGSWDLAVNTLDRGLYPMLSALDIPHVTDTPVLYLVYKTGSEWPSYPEGAQVVKRDLEIRPSDSNIDPNPHIGYYLPQQGRDGANRTEMYLNRTAPRGKGVTDPYTILLWG